MLPPIPHSRWPTVSQPNPWFYKRKTQQRLKRRNSFQRSEEKKRKVGFHLHLEMNTAVWTSGRAPILSYGSKIRWAGYTQTGPQVYCPPLPENMLFATDIYGSIKHHHKVKRAVGFKKINKWIICLGQMLSKGQPTTCSFWVGTCLGYGRYLMAAEYQMQSSGKQSRQAERRNSLFQSSTWSGTWFLQSHWGLSVQTFISVRR